jgi:hypothetical protein
VKAPLARASPIGHSRPGRGQEAEVTAGMARFIRTGLY